MIVPTAGDADEYDQYYSGLKQWREGRTSGYAALERACERFGWLTPFLKHMGAA